MLFNPVSFCSPHPKQMVIQRQEAAHLLRRLTPLVDSVKTEVFLLASFLQPP
jgi:hypothetical protein